MRVNGFTLLFSLAAGLLLAFSTFAQTAVFSDSNAEYTFIVPSEDWKMIARPTAISPNVEYIFRERQQGHLDVRKLTVKPDDLMPDIIRTEEYKLQFLTGYVAGKQEQFSGNLKGAIFNYEYVTRGRNMSGRFYFLKSGANDVYVLRFTGEKDKLRSIRNETDSIARTFDLKKTK